jgi:hypothetical protein
MDNSVHLINITIKAIFYDEKLNLQLLQDQVI